MLLLLPFYCENAKSDNFSDTCKLSKYVRDGKLAALCK
jgi:hypothetical protein